MFNASEFLKGLDSSRPMLSACDANHGTPWKNMHVRFFGKECIQIDGRILLAALGLVLLI